MATPADDPSPPQLYLTFRSMAAWAATLALDTLAPEVCASCEARLDRRAVFCPPCARGVVRAGPPTEETFPIVAFGAYGGPLADALRRLKYGQRPELARPLGQLLRRAAREADLEADLVVPVPLHVDRLVDRGYNQAALLAAEASDELRAPMAPRAVVRTRPTRPQARLARDERLVNVAGSFEASRSARVHGKRVVLVDDVVTTGSTLRACALALLEAGAASVTGLVVALADDRTAGHRSDRSWPGVVIREEHAPRGPADLPLRDALDGHRVRLG